MHFDGEAGMGGDRAGFGNFGTYSVQPPVNGWTAPDVGGLDEDRPPTVFMLVGGRSCCVAGQGFEPWKASADGFTVRR